jgi:signal transduction histidine kinase
VSVQAGPPPGAPGAYTRTGNPDSGAVTGSDQFGTGRQQGNGRPRRRAPWLLRNWRLRSKLAVVLVIPLLLAGILGGLRISSTAQTASDLGAVVTRVGLAQQVSGLLDQLQDERTLVTTYVATGRGPDRADLDKQFAAVDQAAAPVLAAEPADFGPGAATVANAAQVRLRGIAQLRKAYAAVDAKFQTDAVLSTYTDVINSVLALNRATLTVQDQQLTQEAADLTLIGQAKEQIQLQHAALVSATAANSTSHRASATEENLARSSAAQFDSAIAQFRASGQPAAQLLYAQVVSGPQVDDRERIEQGALTAFTLNRQVSGISLDRLDTAAGRTAELIRQVESQLEGQLSADATALSSQASSDSTLNILAVILAVVLTVAVLVLVARSMIRPLRTLRSAAFDVAQRRLPQAIERMQETGSQDAVVEPIGIDTQEEIGEVARAFDAVHAEAIRLAGEQAALRANVNDIFVNLSRRSQGLVKRQLGLIDKLESDEQDPDHLGDLFQLDHLATRMRRNNENLLVLAGAAELRPRRRRPVPTEDVLRASVSEVEDYQRIVVRRAPSVSVAGPAVNDLVHLMAELLDNATNFSPPDSTVVLSSTVDGDRGLVIEISDSGVGIEPQTLRTINAELADPPTVDAAVSRRMGLFVVGRLAQRNDIDVQLQSAPVGQGTIAVVTVPAMLLMTAEQARAAEMATSEFPAATGPASGSWAVQEPAVPAPRTPPRPVEPTYAWKKDQPAPMPPGAVPAPRAPREAAVTGWGEFEVGTEQQRPPARRPEWGAPGGAQPPVPPSLPRRGAPQPRPPQAPQPLQGQPPQAPQSPGQPPQGQPPQAPPSRSGPQAPAPVAALFDAGPTAHAPDVPDDSPIYDEVRTSWFRMDQLASSTGANAAYSGNGGDANSTHSAEEPSRQPGSSPTDRANGSGNGNGRPAEAPESQRAPAGAEDRTAAVLPSRPTPPPPSTPVAPQRTPAPVFAPAPSGANGSANGSGGDVDPDGSAAEWGPIENGWRAAREFTELTREFLTDAGLPKRRAGAQPLPGSFAESPSAAEPSVRNPDAVRGRLREYQRGLRHGRYAQRQPMDSASSTAGGPE